MNGTGQRRELELITAILAGDVQLYHQLIRPYERGVYILSLSQMKNEKDAEGVTQETFVRAFRDLGDFPSDSKFGTWLISIAINEARDRLGRQAPRRTPSRDQPRDQKMHGPAAPLRNRRELPSEVVEREQITSFLEQAVEMLPGIYQQAFLLRDREGLNANETAQMLDINTPVVNGR
jgi:RNA polymerase sigma-70 factor, ECF subfamily